MSKLKITFDRILDDGKEVMVYARADIVTPYTAKNLKIEIHSNDGSDISCISPNELNSIEEEAIEKFNEVEEVEF